MLSRREMIAASAALTISGVPFLGPIGAARVGFKDGEYILNPSQTQIAEGQLDLVMAGTPNAVMMVESEAKELPEDMMLGAVMFGHREFQPVIQAIISMAERCAKEPWPMPEPSKLAAEVKAKISSTGQDVRTGGPEELAATIAQQTANTAAVAKILGMEKK